MEYEGARKEGEKEVSWGVVNLGASGFVRNEKSIDGSFDRSLWVEWVGLESVGPSRANLVLLDGGLFKAFEVVRGVFYLSVAFEFTNLRVSWRPLFSVEYPSLR